MMLAAVLASLAAGLLLGIVLGHGMGQNDDARDKADRAAWDDWRTRHLRRPKPGPGHAQPPLTSPLQQGAEPPRNGTPVIWHPPHASSTMGAPPPNYSAGVHGRWLNYDAAEAQTFATAHRPGYDG